MFQLYIEYLTYKKEIEIYRFYYEDLIYNDIQISA